MNTKELLSLVGSGCFGAIIGWFVYYINRYRKGEVQFSDLVTLIGIIGGASITSLFGKPGEDGAGARFGAYGIGLSVGFFGYFALLIVLVRLTNGIFGWAWFLDGRRKMPKSDETIDGSRPTTSAMGAAPESFPLLHESARRLVAAGDRMESAATATGALNSNAARILEKCEALYEGNKDDCNHLVIAVATALGVTELQPPADAMVDIITTRPGWRQLDDGVAAQAAAEAGDFVIGGLKGGEQTPPANHGHVVVIVSGPLANGKYPTGYTDRDKVHYAARQI